MSGYVTYSLPESARSCGAKLFPLPPSPREYFFGSGIAVGPYDIGYFARLQGPRPAECAREPHPEGTWHREGGTWWR